MLCYSSAQSLSKMKIVRVYHEDDMDDIPLRRLSYTLQFIDNHPLKPENVSIIFGNNAQKAVGEVTVGYGLANEDGYCIPKQDWIFLRKYLGSDEAFINGYRFGHCTAYSVEKEKKLKKLDFLQDRQFAFDIFETIFFHISRLEEYHSTESSKKLSENRLLLIKYELQTVPIVDRLIHIFFDALGIPSAPRKTSISLSHDADHLVKYHSTIQTLHFIGSVAKHHPQKTAAALSNWLKTSILHKVDPYQDWVKILSDRPIEKTIYFIVESDHPFDPSYISHSAIAKAIEISKSKNYKIGLHPSFNTWNNVGQMKKQKMILEKIGGVNVEKNRQHFLNFRFPVTLHILEDVGIKEDSSLGYAHHIGFRCGTGFPYRLYNIETEKTLDITEKPLIWMDRAVWLYSEKDAKAFMFLTRDFIASNSLNTHLHINLHNSAFFDFSMYGIDLHEVLNIFFDGE